MEDKIWKVKEYNKYGNDKNNCLNNQKMIIIN